MTISNASEPGFRRDTGLIARARPWKGWDFLACLLVALIAGAVYLNALQGEWVYDDTRQIVRNTLIQEPAKLGTALMSDVWAFKGAPPGQRVSNYWRPTFVAWIALHYHLFGLDSTVAWHTTNVLLHILATVLVFVLSRRLGLATGVSAGIGLLFAVHPAHVESVAWISGSPDPLLACLLLGSILLLFRSFGDPASGAFRWVPWAASLLLFALAQGAKEVAIFFPLIAAAAVWVVWQGEPGTFLSSMVKRIGPFFAVSIAYVIARPAMIGTAPPGAYADFDPGALVMNAPQVAAFYLRQVFFPYEIGPSYPIRALGDQPLTAANMWIPLTVCAVVGLAMLAAAFRWRIAMLGLTIWLFTLAPAMNVGAFHREQAVHDRYLYFPLLGILFIVLPIAYTLLQRLALPEARAQLVVAIVCAAAAVPLAIQTWRYNPAWMSNVALWERGVISDPTSGFNAHQLAVALHAAAQRKDGSFDAALLERASAAADSSLKLDPTSINALMISGEVAVAQGKFGDAERVLHEALRVVGPDSQTYETAQIYQRLAVTYERQRRLPEAEAVLREAVRRLPQYRCMMTHMLAIVLYTQGRKPEALAALESVRAGVRQESNPDSRMVLFRLGQLYDESRRPAEAAAAYREFIGLAASQVDPMSRQSVKAAQDRLRQMGG